MGGEYGMAIKTPFWISLTLLTVPGSIWFYAPNKGAPVAWAFFFSVSCAVHIWQCWLVHLPKYHFSTTKCTIRQSHYKSWKFTGLLPWASLIFAAGYIMREVGAYNYDNVDVFISSICLVYAAP